MEKAVCVIVGAGTGNGAAFAARFSKEGYHLALLARSRDLIKKLSSELENTHPCNR